MKQSEVAHHVKSKLIQNKRSSIWYGDIQIIEECAAECGIVQEHPRKTINVVLNALDKSPLFRKSYIFTDINGSRRKYRCFSIIEKAED